MKRLFSFLLTKYIFHCKNIITRHSYCWNISNQRTRNGHCTNEALILLKIFPILGPRMVKVAITTMATKTRINAYSTRPWPFSLGMDNMGTSSFLRDFLRFLTKVTHFTPSWKIAKCIIITKELTTMKSLNFQGIHQQAVPGGLFCGLIRPC